MNNLYTILFLLLSLFSYSQKLEISIRDVQKNPIEFSIHIHLDGKIIESFNSDKLGSLQIDKKLWEKYSKCRFSLTYKNQEIEMFYSKNICESLITKISEIGTPYFVTNDCNVSKIADLLKYENSKIFYTQSVAMAWDPNIKNSNNTITH